MGRVGSLGSCRVRHISDLRDVNHLLAQWRSVAQHHTAMPSWRGLVSRDFWRDAPAVLIVDKSGRRNTYEVYINGDAVARGWRLDEAKAMAEERLGPLKWKRANTAQIRALHYYFGWTTEFTDPTLFYVGAPG